MSTSVLFVYPSPYSADSWSTDRNIQHCCCHFILYMLKLKNLRITRDGESWKRNEKRRKEKGGGGRKREEKKGGGGKRRYRMKKGSRGERRERGREGGRRGEEEDHGNQSSTLLRRQTTMCAECEQNTDFQKWWMNNTVCEKGEIETNW